MLHVGNQKGRIKGEKMKAVLISVRPKWCELIASGKKRIEVRKTRPKIETPFTVYVYMTKHKWIFKLLPFLKNRFAKVIGEFVCDKIVIFEKSELGISCKDFFALAESCVRVKEMRKYIGNKKIAYGWHISDLKIYDNPKELGEFSYPAEHDFTKRTIKESREMGFICHGAYITRPPQSWCYVEEI